MVKSIQKSSKRITGIEDFFNEDCFWSGKLWNETLVEEVQRVVLNTKKFRYQGWSYVNVVLAKLGQRDIHWKSQTPIAKKFTEYFFMKWKQLSETLMYENQTLGLMKIRFVFPFRLLPVQKEI